MAENGERNEIRHAYRTLDHDVAQCPHDPNAVERLRIRISQLCSAVEQRRQLFEPAEVQTILTNCRLMVERLDSIAIQASAENAGIPINPDDLMEKKRGDGPGRPKVKFDKGWLQWALRHKSISGIAATHGIHRHTVRREMKRLGLHGTSGEGDAMFHVRVVGPGQGRRSHATRVVGADARPGSPPRRTNNAAGGEGGVNEGGPRHSWPTGRPISEWSEQEIDLCAAAILERFPNHGASMLAGCMSRILHVTVPISVARASLTRINPYGRVFGRATFTRRSYKVHGPNALWHHDGQHELIRWGIVVHAFIDGYSRLVTGARASSNNRGSTVLAVFLQACQRYGIPQRLRGDHGTENIAVAGWMEVNYAHVRKGPYIWGRSVHNQRIERLWVDMVTGFLAKWRDLFSALERDFSLDVENESHIWLLHHLFLCMINSDLDIWVDTWNKHKMRLPHESTQCPEELFGFGMVSEGRRGDVLNMDADEVRMWANAEMVEHEAIRRGAAIPWDSLNEIMANDPRVPTTGQQVIDAMDAWLDAQPSCQGGSATALVTRWVLARAFCLANHVPAF